MSKTAAREIRSRATSQPFAVRTLASGQKQIAGYAIIWNSPSEDLGGFTEICSPQMLTRTLRQNPDVLALRDHKQELLLGRTSAGTLTLRPDSTGLAFTVTLPQTAIGDDTAENVRLRNLTSCSFGFIAVDDAWVMDADGNVTRTLLDVDLFEISITSFPAYQQTSVNTRSKAAEVRSSTASKRDDDGDNDDDSYRPECDPDSDDFDPDAICDQDDGDDDADDDDNLDEDNARADRLRVRMLFAHRMAL